jgi:hypothetical protein
VGSFGNRKQVDARTDNRDSRWQKLNKSKRTARREKDEAHSHRASEPRAAARRKAALRTEAAPRVVTATTGEATIDEATGVRKDLRKSTLKS